jgi:NitT/TauT family transport system substrate-binding protein
MMKAIAAILLAAGTLVGSTVSGIAQNLTPVKFSLDWTLQGNHAIWGLALKNKDFEANGLKVTMDRGYGSGDTIVKVAAGAYDIGFTDINSLIKFNAENPDRYLIAFYQVFDRTPNSIIALAKSGIKSPADLAGKKIGAPEADSSRLMFSAFAKANKIDPASINWVTIAPNLRETMLVQGQVDAISGFSSTSVFNLISAGVPEKDITVLGYADNGLDLYGSALVATPNYIAKHPDVI